jgi:GDPmannose 4,6-dehydratase
MREIVASTIWMSPGTRPERTPPGERESGSGPPLEPGDTPAADACSGARPPALGLAKVPPAMPDKRALIIGIAGQDGSYLAELLLDEGYEVFGVVRQPASAPFDNLAAVRDDLELLQADVLDELSLVDVLSGCRPSEVYNLASPSFVPMSWRQPVLTAEFAAVGCTALLEAIRRVDAGIRFYQASSSEIFGEPREVPQTEDTPLHPVTPYGVAKAYAHFITLSYRRRYGLHASSGILYNHESPRRPPDFVTRKVSRAAAAISLGLESEVALGDLDARRDWGYAGDYVRAMWLMLQQPEPGDYVIATGESHSVRELAAGAFAHVGLDWEEHVRVDDSLLRGKAELHDLVGDSHKARAALGWSPTIDFEQLVRLLVDTDVERLRARLEPAESLVDG